MYIQYSNYKHRHLAEETDLDASPQDNRGGAFKGGFCFLNNDRRGEGCMMTETEDDESFGRKVIRSRGKDARSKTFGASATTTSVLSTNVTYDQ